MEKIDFKKVIADIGKDKYDIFLLEFPDLKKNIDEIKKSPNCGSCISTNIPPLFNHPKFAEKMKMIYGSDVQIDMSNLPKYQQRFVTNAETLNIPLKEWDKWWKDNAGDQKRQFRLITTFFNPKTETVTVSFVALSPEK